LVVGIAEGGVSGGLVRIIRTSSGANQSGREKCPLAQNGKAGLCMGNPVTLYADFIFYMPINDREELYRSQH